MQTIRRVLIVHPYGIGDLLFVTPILRALRLSPSVEKVDLLLGSRTRSLIETNPHVDEIFVVDKDKFHAQSNKETRKDIWELGKKLKANKYNLMLDYSMRREHAFAAQFFLGIEKRVGFDYKGRGFFHNYKVPLPESFIERHVVDYYSELAEKVGIEVESRWMELYLNEESRVKADQWIREKIGFEQTFMTVSLGGGESWGVDAGLKRWPLESFAKLMDQISNVYGIANIVLLGSSGEKALAQKLKKKTKTSFVDLVGELDLMTSAAMIEKSKLFVGNDGGLVHIAHALGTPVVAFYGPADPKVYGPYPESAKAIAIYDEKCVRRPCYYKFRYNKDCDCLQGLGAERAWSILEKTGYFTRLFSQSQKVN